MTQSYELNAFAKIFIPISKFLAFIEVIALRKVPNVNALLFSIDGQLPR